MENQSKTENVTSRSILLIHILNIDDLWSHVPRSAASDKEVLFRFVKLGKAEISDHTVIVIFGSEQNVLRLQIPMHDSLAVHLLKTQQQPFDHSLCLLLRETVFTLNYFQFYLHLIIELTALKQLKDNVQ